MIVDLKPRIASHKPRILIDYPRFEVKTQVFNLQT